MRPKAKSWICVYLVGVVLGFSTEDVISGVTVRLLRSRLPPNVDASPNPPPAPDPQQIAVNSFKVVADHVAQRFAKSEGIDPDQHQYPLEVSVSTDNISVRKTDDLVTPFRGEVHGLATITVPKTSTDDGIERQVYYDVTWPFNYRDSKWDIDQITVAPRDNDSVGNEPALASSMTELVRLRIVFWGTGLAK